MSYTRYTPEQKEFIKKHYAEYSNVELAATLGIDTPRKVTDIARRLGVKWRAENGAPRWREPRADAQPSRSVWLR